VSPAESLGPIGPFDVVTAAFLLSCMPDRSSLDAVANAIAANLKPGGRFVSTVGNLSAWPGVDYRPYGMSGDVTGPLPDGAAYHITFLLEDDSFTIEDYAHSQVAYEGALRQAGLTQIRWHAPRVTVEGLATFGPDFWRVYLTYPPIVRLSAERPAL
jgi:SAM-dependent methyltransferase